MIFFLFLNRNTTTAIEKDSERKEKLCETPNILTFLALAGNVIHLLPRDFRLGCVYLAYKN